MEYLLLDEKYLRDLLKNQQSNRAIYLSENDGSGSAESDSDAAEPHELDIAEAEKRKK